MLHLTKEECNLLTKLVQRTNKDLLVWYKINYIEYLREEWVCLICNKSIFNLSISAIDARADELINDHGMRHLKNSELLAFI